MENVLRNIYMFLNSRQSLDLFLENYPAFHGWSQMCWAIKNVILMHFYAFHLFYSGYIIQKFCKVKAIESKSNIVRYWPWLKHVCFFQKHFQKLTSMFQIDADVFFKATILYPSVQWINKRIWSAPVRCTFQLAYWACNYLI